MIKQWVVGKFLIRKPHSLMFRDIEILNVIILSRVPNGSDLIHLEWRVLMVLFNEHEWHFIYTMYSLLYVFIASFFLFHTLKLFLFYFLFHVFHIKYSLSYVWSLMSKLLNTYINALIYNLYIILLFSSLFFYFHSNYCHRKTIGKYKYKTIKYTWIKNHANKCMK